METKNLKNFNFMSPFYGWASTASRPQPLQGGSLLLYHCSQKFLVSTSEGGKTESTLETPSGFEHGTPGLRIQCLNHQAIVQILRTMVYEVFKTLNNLNPVFMKDIFHCSPNVTRKKHNLYIHTESCSMPEYIKSTASLLKFKKNY